MKKRFTLLSSALIFSAMGFMASADDFVVPEAEIIVPINGEAELLYNMFEVTWGYYGLVDNMGDDPISATLTFPDNTVKTVRGTIDDANAEGESQKDVPTTRQNALKFTGFMAMNDDYQLIQQYGTYKVSIPEGVVLVNGVPNPPANLSFKINGSGNEGDVMSQGTLAYPATNYTSFLSVVELTWGGQPISFVNGAESVDLQVMVDGEPSDPFTARIEIIQDSGENDDQLTELTVLYIMVDPFLTYMDATSVEINIPAGLVQNEASETNPGQTLEFTLLPTLGAVASPTDNSTLYTSDPVVTLSWNGLSVTPNSPVITARQANSNTEYKLTPIYLEDKAAVSLSLASLPIGDYNILVPEASFIILIEENIIGDKSAINQEVYLTYSLKEGTTTGVKELQTLDSYKVYSLDGVKLMETSDYEVVKSLSPGIYVINGKKVIVERR